MHLMRRSREIMHARRPTPSVKPPRQSAPELLATTKDGGEYLTSIGNRVRELRARRGMTRKILARDSRVSERYLAQLEGGQGNISIVLLRQVAQAMSLDLSELVRDGPERP